MKAKTNTPQRLSSLMKQGSGPKPVMNPKQDLEGLMHQGKSPSCDMKEPGKAGLRKLMHQ